MTDIELVIKIPEEIYKASQILDVKHEDTVQIPLEVIASGTPLPKSHGDLIDKSELTTVTEIKPDGSECTYVPYSEIENANVVVEADKEVDINADKDI